MLEAGAHLGAYTIVRPLGAGGMGVVYLARHRHIGRDAAIKVLLPELTKNDDIIARFLTEARATAAIRHPGIVEILDCDIDATGRAYIVMEYLRGESLASCLARARRALSALPSVVSVGTQVASGLAAAHERGIVHRDLKPDNLFLATDGSASKTVTVKILDFGIAKLVSGNDEGQANKTRTGSMLGTPAYMSPEQARDASSIDDRADVYALGCILFEMVAGRPPFVRPGAGEVMIAHVIEAPPTLSSLVPDVDRGLEALVSQMLEKDPAARPQTMILVQSRLEALMAGRPGPLMTAIMPTVDTSGPVPTGVITATTTPPPATGTARAQAVPLELPAELSSPSGRMIPGGTLLLPATDAATTTHSTTMSGSASQVEHQPMKTFSSRKRPAVLGAAIAGVGLVVLIAVIALRPGPPATTTSLGAGATPSPSPSPTLAPTTPPPPQAVVPPPEMPARAAPKEKQIVIEVDSDPPGAEVWLPDDTAPRGHTPFKVSIAPNAPNAPNAAPTRVILKARGYSDKTLDLDPEKPDPMSVTLEKIGRDHGKRKGSEPGTGKSKDGYRMMGD